MSPASNTLTEEREVLAEGQLCAAASGDGIAFITIFGIQIDAFTAQRHQKRSKVKVVAHSQPYAVPVIVAVSPLGIERHTRFPGAKAGGQIGELGTGFTMQVNGCADGAAGPGAIITANNFGAIDFIVEFLQIKKPDTGVRAKLTGSWISSLWSLQTAGEGVNSRYRCSRPPISGAYPEPVQARRLTP